MRAVLPCRPGAPRNWRAADAAWPGHAVVVSSSEDRHVMATCLHLGAADFLIKPLRANELRNLWARVYWWRRVRPP